MPKLKSDQRYNELLIAEKLDGMGKELIAVSGVSSSVSALLTGIPESAYRLMEAAAKIRALAQ